jgi:5'-nucleotidase
MTRCLGRISAICLLAVGMAAALISVPAHGDAFGPPQPPTGVVAKVTAGGIQVSWAPSPDAAPAITQYVVHAGPDSCPVTVSAGQTSAVMPFVKGPSTVAAQVQAVSEYGFSANAAASPVLVPSKASADYRNVQFLEFSDFHGAIEKSSSSIGAATLTNAFNADRKTVLSTFVVSAGDNIGGAPVISSEFSEMPTGQALDLMGLDVSGFGNHEHDRPITHIRSVIEATDFPWVASNYSSLVPLQAKDNGTAPFTVLDRGRVKVGFVAMNTEDLAELVKDGNLDYGRNRSKEIVVSPSTAGLEKAVRQARAEGAQIVVALLHEGWAESINGVATGRLLDLARSLVGVDVVFGGHTHQQYASLINGHPVVEVPNSGQMYSRTIVCVNTRTDKVVGSSVDFVTKAMLAATTEDPTTAAMVAGYKAQLGSRLDARVGEVSAVFPRGGTPPVERSGETPMGDFAADAIRVKYGTQFAVMNGGGVRDTLPARGYSPMDATLVRPSIGSTGPYDVTLGDVVSVFPFGNTAATTTMTGAQLWKALENGVSGWPTDGRFPQVSGFRFVFDPTRVAGSRITSVTLPDGTPIPADGTVYTVATVDYMVYGGDGYVGVFNPTTAVMREPYIDAVIEAITADAAAGRVTQMPVLDGRITRAS